MPFVKSVIGVESSFQAPVSIDRVLKRTGENRVVDRRGGAEGPPSRAGVVWTGDSRLGVLGRGWVAQR